MRLLATILLTAAAALAGCSSTDPDISGAEVERGVASELRGRGIDADSIECPDSLGGSVGSSARCEVALDGATYGVTVSVTEAEGGEAILTVKVDDEPS